MRDLGAFYNHMGFYSNPNGNDPKVRAITRVLFNHDLDNSRETYNPSEYAARAEFLISKKIKDKNTMVDFSVGMPPVTYIGSESIYGKKIADINFLPNSEINNLKKEYIEFIAEKKSKIAEKPSVYQQPAAIYPTCSSSVQEPEVTPAEKPAELVLSKAERSASSSSVDEPQPEQTNQPAVFRTDDVVSTEDLPASSQPKSELSDTALTEESISRPASIEQVIELSPAPLLLSPAPVLEQVPAQPATVQLAPAAQSVRIPISSSITSVVNEEPETLNRTDSDSEISLQQDKSSDAILPTPHQNRVLARRAVTAGLCNIL